MKDKFKRRIVYLGITLLAFIGIGVAAIISTTRQKADHAMAMIQTVDKQEVKEMVNENIAKEETMKLRDHWTIAGFGLDSRNPENLKNGNSDVIILFDMNGKTGAIKMVSVYRDTCMNIGNGKYRKANAAYATGGPKQAVQMLNENLDVEIDDYVAVTWKSVADAINILGGVDLEVTKSEFRYINAFITETVKSTGIGSYQLKAPGMQHLDGVQAVAYCRLRLMDNDFKRTERQQKVLQLVLEKAKHADFATLNNIIETVFPQTASSIDTDDLLAAAKNIMKLHIAETQGFPTQYSCKNIGGDYVFPESLADNVSILHEFLYDSIKYQVSGRVKEISDAIYKKEYGKRTVEKKVEQSKTEIETWEAQTQETWSSNEYSPELQPSIKTPDETTSETESMPGIANETEKTTSEHSETKDEEMMDQADQADQAEPTKPAGPASDKTRIAETEATVTVPDTDIVLEESECNVQ